MKRNFILFVIVAAISQLTFAQATWNADPMHSNARFSVEHLGISFVDGEFTSFSGSVETTTDTDFSDAVFNFSIDVNSINTRVEDRNTHLKSDDFFNAEKYPNITLENATLMHIKDNEYVLEGDLTIRDITKEVTFDLVQNNGIITDPWEMTRVGFTATTEINRKDFNINYNDKLPNGIDVVGNKIKIVVNLELVKE